MDKATWQVYERVNAGEFDDDIEFLVKALRARWYELNPIEKIKEDAGIKVPSDFAKGVICRVKKGTVSPKYVEGALVRVIGESSRSSGRVTASILNLPKAANRDPRKMRFKVGYEVNFLVDQLEIVEGV